MNGDILFKVANYQLVCMAVKQIILAKKNGKTSEYSVLP